MGKPDQADEMHLKAQVAAKPFKRWALDFVGPFNPKSNQKAYILVTMDYMTKWVEAEALPNTTEEVVIKFIFKLSICYGLPREVITNGGHNLQLIESPTPWIIIILNTELLLHTIHKQMGKWKAPIKSWRQS
jgi:hypothetical protein